MIGWGVRAYRSGAGRGGPLRVEGDDGAGRISVDIEVANDGDLVLVCHDRLQPDKVRRETIRGVVGSRAMRLVLPEAVVKRLGLALGDLAPVRYADGRRGRLPLVHGVFVRLLGRDGTYSAISDPDRETALIGGIVLGDLDLVVDYTQHRLVPRDPRGRSASSGGDRRAGNADRSRASPNGWCLHHQPAGSRPGDGDRDTMRGAVARRVVARPGPSTYHPPGRDSHRRFRGRIKAMRTRGENDVGRFSVEIEVTNNDDLALMRRGLLQPEQVRRETIRGVVDSGAVKLVLPEAVVKRLGLPPDDPINVRYADTRRVRRKQAQGASVQLLGRHGTFTAIVEPKRDTALIGAIVLEELDLLVDCRQQRLVPRDPSGPLCEIE
jgi:predicted aspartyl protease